MRIMSFRRRDGDYDSIRSTYTSLCAAFLILIGVLWILGSLANPLYLPDNPILGFIYTNLGGFIFLGVGGLMILLTKILDRKKIEEEEY